MLLERENRFLARCRFPSGEVVHAHVPDRGRLLNLLVPGARVWLFTAPEGVRRTRWSLLIAEDPQARVLTVIDPAGANARVRGLLDRGLAPGVARDWTVRPEVRIGDSRIDFLLSRGKERLALEVKSVGVVRDGIALFPDAPTTRGARHLRSLEEFVRTKQGAAMVLFVAQREDASAVCPDEEIDPAFAAELRRVAPVVELRAVRFAVRPDGCEFIGEIPIAMIGAAGQ